MFSLSSGPGEILVGLEVPASDSSFSGTNSSWTDLCWGAHLGGVLDQVVWPALPQGPGEILVSSEVTAFDSSFSGLLQCARVSWLVASTAPKKSTFHIRLEAA